MGDGLTEKQKLRQTSPTPLGDIFDEMLPEYLAMGMPYDLYWDGPYGTRRAFLEAYRLRMKNEQMLSDRNNWYLGQYMMAALRSVQLTAATVWVKKLPDPTEYPDKPFFEKHEEEQKEAERQKKEEDQSKLAMAMFQQMVAKMNGNIIRRIEKQKQEGTGQ